METVIIENAIIKIGILLALGFGDAGSEIIGSNMSKGEGCRPNDSRQKKICNIWFLWYKELHRCHRTIIGRGYAFCQ